MLEAFCYVSQHSDWLRCRMDAFIIIIIIIIIIITHNAVSFSPRYAFLQTCRNSRHVPVGIIVKWGRAHKYADIVEYFSY